MFITQSDEAKVHPVLTKLAIAYPQQGLVAEKLAPPIDVGEENEDGTYFVFDKTNLSGVYDDIRALGSRASTFDWKVSTASYHCEEHTLEKPIDWREFKKWKKYLDLAKTTQEIELELLLLNYDKRIAELFTDTSNYFSSDYYETLSGTAQWSDYVNSDPEGNVEDAREQVALGAAEPNTIAIPVKVWRKIRRHPSIRALMKEQDSRQLTEDGFPARLWGMKAVYPGARQNTAMPGVSEVIERIWGHNVWIGVVNPRPSKRTMSFAYTLRAQGMLVETYEDKPKKSDVVRVQHQISDERIVANTAGYLIKDVISA